MTRYLIAPELCENKIIIEGLANPVPCSLPKKGHGEMCAGAAFVAWTSGGIVRDK